MRKTSHGIALLEVLLVMTILGCGLTAMLKIYTYNEVIWQRTINTYCAYLKRSESEAREMLRGQGVDSDWNEDWLRDCQKRLL